MGLDKKEIGKGPRDDRVLSGERKAETLNIGSIMSVRWKKYSVSELLYAALCGIHGAFALLLLPRTLFRAAQAFMPGGAGVANEDFKAFGTKDAATRPYYDKLARDFKNHGRYGYVWDDGLGTDLGSRIYSNWATYRLLGILGTRSFCAIGYICFVFALTGVVATGFGFLIAGIVAVLLLGCPVCLCCYTHLGKPELIWWFFATIFFVVGWWIPGVIPGLVWSVVAFANLAVSVMLFIFIAPAILLQHQSLDVWIGFMIGCLPGILKHLFRSWQMNRTGQLKSVVDEQTGLWKQGIFFNFKELLIVVPFTLSIMVSSFEGNRWVTGFVLVFCCVGLFWFNWRCIYINDPQSFYLGFLSITVTWATVCESPFGLVCAMVLAYSHPSLCGTSRRSRIPDPDPFKNRAQAGKLAWKTYPDLEPRTLHAPSEFLNMFDRIPDNCRVAFETHGYIRTSKGLRRFGVWSEDILPLRKIDLLAEEYTRIAELEVDKAIVSRFNGDEMTGFELTENARIMGIGWIIAYSESTINTLVEAGWKQEITIDLDEMSADALSIFDPFPTSVLVLLRAPEDIGFVLPFVDLRFDGNCLSWQAVANRQYDIRFRYYSNFKADIDGVPVELAPYTPYENLPLKFIRCIAPASGRLRLEYITKFV